jgi:hypothetical protein
MNPAPLVAFYLTVTGIVLPPAIATAAPASKSITAFCRANPNLDFPDRAFYGSAHKAGVPPELTAVEATDWRCMAGKVYVCAGGAAGSACKKMDPSRTPSTLVRETCEDNPGQDFVASAVIGNSSSTWRCRGRMATIIDTVPLDARGFMKQTWAPLFKADGKVNTDVELGADPR